jgi:hypothetical protein
LTINKTYDIKHQEKNIMTTLYDLLTTDAINTVPAIPAVRGQYTLLRNGNFVRPVRTANGATGKEWQANGVHDTWNDNGQSDDFMMFVMSNEYLEQNESRLRHADIVWTGDLAEIIKNQCQC